MSTRSQKVADNFHAHAFTIPAQTTGMQVFQLPALTYADSGLPCDTFNIIHITHGDLLTQETLSAVLQYYRSNNSVYCIWISEDCLTSNVLKVFEQLSLKEANKEPGMLNDLQQYQPVADPLHQHIQVASTPEQVAEVATIIAANWSPPDQHVLAYYQRTVNHLLNLDNAIKLLVYYDAGKPVSVMEMFPTDQHTIGLYGLATLATSRGRGIGSAMISYALNLAKEQGHKAAILQASEDGIGIYKRYGFEVVSYYYEYQP